MANYGEEEQGWGDVGVPPILNPLREDYKNDILASGMDNKRQYRTIQNANNTISLEDVTDYDQNGDTFSAGDINQTNNHVNIIYDMVTSLGDLVDELLPLKEINRRIKNDITSDLGTNGANLFNAISEQDLAKYGFTIGDYFVGRSYSYKYYLAHMNLFRADANSNAFINSNHLAIVVAANFRSQWSNTPSSEYEFSELHTALSSTMLNTIKADFITLFGGSTGAEHIKVHAKEYPTTSSLKSWVGNQSISALSLTQVCGVDSKDSSGAGEAYQQLDLFKKYSYGEILGTDRIWLRDIANSGYAMCLSGQGDYYGYAMSTYLDKAAAIVLIG